MSFFFLYIDWNWFINIHSAESIGVFLTEESIEFYQFRYIVN